jgi:hypothetical protein
MIRDAGVLLAVLLPTVAGALDIEPGTWQLSGATEAGYVRFGERNNALRLQASAIHYSRRNFGIGIGAAFAREQYTYVPRDSDTFLLLEDSRTAWALSPVLTWNSGPERTSAFLEAGLGVISVGSDTAVLGTLAGGFRYFATDHLSLDLALALQRGGTPGQVDGVLSLGFGISVFLGRGARAAQAVEAPPAQAPAPEAPAGPAPVAAGT